MNWYLVVKYLHIAAVAITIGGIFARQLVRRIAGRSDDIKAVAALLQAAIRMERVLVIPGSNLMILFGIVLAVMQEWPIFGFLQGSDRNWLLVSNLLLIAMIALIPGIFIPHNRKVTSLLQSALAAGKVTPELSAALNEKKDLWAHYAEQAIVLVVAALMVLKPF